MGKFNWSFVCTYFSSGTTKINITINRNIYCRVFIGKDYVICFRTCFNTNNGYLINTHNRTIWCTITNFNFPSCSFTRRGCITRTNFKCILSINTGICKTISEELIVNCTCYIEWSCS